LSKTWRFSWPSSWSNIVPYAGVHTLVLRWC
jgi:hypothetical protein